VDERLDVLLDVLLDWIGTRMYGLVPPPLDATWMNWALTLLA